MISGISVQPSTTASQPSSFMRPMTRWKQAIASGLKTPATSSSKMMRLISARSAVSAQVPRPRAVSFSG